MERKGEEREEGEEVEGFRTKALCWALKGDGWM